MDTKHIEEGLRDFAKELKNGDAGEKAASSGLILIANKLKTKREPMIFTNESKIEQPVPHRFQHKRNFKPGQ